MHSQGFLPRTDLFAPNTFTAIAAGTFGDSFSFWVDDDISSGGSGADGGLGDGYIRFNNIGRYIGLPNNALNLRFGQFELDLPFSQARSINPSGYDIYGQANIAGPLGTTNNPFTLGAGQRGFEIGGYPNNGNFSWSISLVNGSNNSTPLRDFKDIYSVFPISSTWNAIRLSVKRSKPQDRLARATTPQFDSVDSITTAAMT